MYINVGAQRVYVAASGTKHLEELSRNRHMIAVLGQRVATGMHGLYQRILLAQYNNALQRAYSAGVVLNQTIQVRVPGGVWEFKIVAGNNGPLPVLIHAAYYAIKS